MSSKGVFCVYDWYEIYECPKAPTEAGRYIGASPILEQVQNAVDRHNAEVRHSGVGSAWFVKGVRSNGEKVIFL